MNMPTAAALVAPVWNMPVTLTPEQKREQELGKWLAAKAALDAAKAAEIKARKAVIAAFPLPADKKEGTVNVPLNNGYSLKVVLKQNYNIDQDNVDAALDAIEQSGPDGKFIVDRLVKFKGELSISEYRLLADENATAEQKAIKKLIDGVLTITDGTPTLELKEPKGK